MLSRSYGQLENLEEMVSTVEYARIEEAVLHGLKQGNEVLKAIHKEMNIESVERLLEDNLAAREYQKEIDTLLMQTLTVEDEEAVQEELSQLQEEILNSPRLNVPVSSVDNQIAEVATSSEHESARIGAKIAMTA